MSKFKAPTIAILIAVLLIAAELAVGKIYAGGVADGMPGKGGVTAQVEEATAQMRLTRSYMKTESASLVLNTTFVDAFTPTNVVCPAEGCVVRVIVSTQISGVDANAGARMQVLVDDSDIGVHPNSIVNIGSVTDGSFPNARTFQWMATGLSGGVHTVDVNVRTTSGSAFAAFRAMTIQVMRESP